MHVVPAMNEWRRIIMKRAIMSGSAAVCLMLFTLPLVTTPVRATPCPAPDMINQLAPPVLTRQQWGAKKPSLAMRPHRLQRITLHHSATRQSLRTNLARKLRNLQAFSQSSARLASGRRKKPWADIPYHYYINAAGKIGEGRDLAHAGDTNTDYDPAGHLLIVLEGNFERERLTKAQKASLIRLMAWLSLKYSLDLSTIKGHNAYAHTLCPGRYFTPQIPDLIIRAGQLVEQARTGCH